ncbi:MAG: HAD family hydrolase [Mycobacterium sp.]
MGGDRRAVLFDVDGTLVDSTYLHVDAWRRAFADLRLPVETWRIHRCIGMDGSTLIDTLSDGADDAAQRRLSEQHGHYYERSSSLLNPLPGAADLLRRIASAGIEVVLASSAPEDELRMSRKVLACDDVISAATSSRDVETAKPRPDIVKVALMRADVEPNNAVLVGDAVWDMMAANRAGVMCIGVRSGGVSDRELETAGAEAVFDNPEDLLQHLDDSPIGTFMVPSPRP